MNQQEFETRNKRFQQDIDVAKQKLLDAIGIAAKIPASIEASGSVLACIDAIADANSFIDRLRFPGVAPETGRWVEPIEITFEELAEEQGVKPMSDTSKIIGIFPDTDTETGCKG